MKLLNSPPVACRQTTCRCWSAAAEAASVPESGTGETAAQLRSLLELDLHLRTPVAGGADTPERCPAGRLGNCRQGRTWSRSSATFPMTVSHPVVLRQP